MDVPATCLNCGAGLPPGARFCPKCGAGIDAVIVAPPIHPTPVAPRARRPWWIIGVPLAIVVIMLAAWAILAGMPFGNRHEEIQTLTQGTSDTIGEATPSSATVPQIGETTMAPTTTSAPPPAPVTSTPPVVQMPPLSSTNAPMTSATTPKSNRREISADDATDRLREYFAENNPYPNSNGCIALQNPSYSNHGYAIEVRDTCVHDSPLLGRWRVDAVTGDIYEDDSGRYVRP